MTLLVQITDTHITHRDGLLYGQVDTAENLRDTVQEINRIRPRPEALIVTGDLVETPDRESYEYFIELISAVQIPVCVLPGNHDDPALMADVFSGTPYFPVTDDTCQFALELSDVRLLALNSHAGGSELPELGPRNLAWLEQELERSDKPTVIGLHHPPMMTGIEFIDMAGTDWFQELRRILGQHEQVQLVICGHCHTDMSGRIDQVPVYMAGSVAHQLIAARSVDIAPSFEVKPSPPVLHHFVNGQFVSGSYPWPINAEVNRIDRQSGIPWETLKLQMMGSKAP